MRYNKNDRLLSLLVNSGGYLMPQTSKENFKVSKTLYPYLIGKRKNKYFYDLEKSLYGIKSTLDALKIIVSCGGEITFVDVPTGLESRLLYDTQANFIRWKRGALSKADNADLVILNRGNSESLVEAHRKCLLLSSVGSSTMSQISYPFNINITHPLISDWFLGLVYAAFKEGKKVPNSHRSKRCSTLLGVGRNKKEFSHPKTG